MGRAEELFDRILKEGETAINNFILSQKAEELFLDFKRSSDNGSGNRLNQIDRNNLAKAISGFGNSEGGIIVWGIDCSRDVDGFDAAKAKIFIENPERFAGWLNSAISGCTIPPHQSVRNEPIVLKDKKGCVITLIPKSNNTPHQTVGELRYYIRAGSSFVPTPHDVLAGMFGRRPQPHIIHQFLIGPLKVNQNYITIDVGFLLKNLGPGIASDIFFTSMIWGGIGDNCKLEFDRPDTEKWHGNFSLGIHLSLISKPDFKLPPDAFWVPTTLHITIAPPMNKNLSIKATIGCSSGRSYNFSFENTPEKIQELYNECMQKHSSGKIEEIKREFVDRLLNTDYQKADS